ncbi:MAG: hypothetical protein IJ400_02600 [Clostridia bacterium]|nr:hypothetical protein [Clostridia bacterium]
MKQKGMLLYYDWIEPFSLVEEEDFKRLILAMLRYHAYGTKPPVFKGTAGIVAQFVFPQLERAKTNSENGRKGALALHKQD